MSTDERQPARRVVLLGASAGGVEALSTVVSGLPPDLAAAVLVVLHVPAFGTSVLPHILDRCGPLPARHASDGEPLLNGCIYVAPPDRHLMTEEGRVRVTSAPKENGVRPSVDTLFRTAARTHGPNVVACVLSGTLDDGTAGLMAVKARGGVTIAQDPADAAFPSMPESAVRFVRPGHVAPARDIAGLIADHVAAGEIRDVAARERGATMGTEDGGGEAAADQEGLASELTCPECGGTLWEKAAGDLLRFRCRVGHAYSAESLFSHQLESLEGALWAAVVALQERGDLATRLARRMADRGQGERANRYEAQAADARRRAERVRSAIIHLSHSGDLAEEPVADEA
jgi:two-component system chemotaxis response regulator CheB